MTHNITLPDYRKFTPFLDVIAKLQARQFEPEPLPVKPVVVAAAAPVKSAVVAPAAPSVEAQLASGGVDIDASELIRNPEDNTLVWRNGTTSRRIITYIKDLNIGGYATGKTLPKYHVAYCMTLANMIDSGKATRYTVTNREDGSFELDYPGEENDGDKELDVCKNCLSSLNSNQGKKEFTFDTFSIADFFKEYPRTL
jgi:hypothetical protein